MNQPTATLYDNDYHAWAEQQVDLLRQGEFDQLDYTVNKIIRYSVGHRLRRDRSGLPAVDV